jgi:hypothetical protein
MSILLHVSLFVLNSSSAFIFSVSSPRTLTETMDSVCIFRDCFCRFGLSMWLACCNSCTLFWFVWSGSLLVCARPAIGSVRAVGFCIAAWKAEPVISPVAGIAYVGVSAMRRSIISQNFAKTLTSSLWMGNLQIFVGGNNDSETICNAVCKQGLVSFIGCFGIISDTKSAAPPGGKGGQKLS